MFINRCPVVEPADIRSPLLPIAAALSEAFVFACGLDRPSGFLSV
jgi:hypothetical protein